MMNLLKIYGLENKVNAVAAAHAAAKAPKPVPSTSVPKATTPAAEVRHHVKVYAVKTNRFNWECPSLTVLPRPAAELDLPAGATHAVCGVTVEAGPSWVEVTGPDGEHLGRVFQRGSDHYEIGDLVLVVKVW